jgi:D-xylose transport system substrate-binding protein
VGVGRLMAKTMLEKGKSEGDFAFIKGDKGDPNATFLFQGIMEVLKPNMDAGKIKNVCETFTDGWKPDAAQKNMEQCLTSVNNKVDAVISQNDGMAGGVVAALEAQGLAGTVPVTGQDGDKAALNRVALGTQLVSVWKDARVLGKAAAEFANMIADGKAATELPGVGKFSGGAKGVEVNAVLIPPNPITRDNLSDVIDGGWISKEEACAGVAAGSVAACN